MALTSTKCNFFMHSTDYPAAGCFCCETYDPVDDTKGTAAKSYAIYQTCVPGTDAAKPDCFNAINL